ncbi:MAG: DUF4302 domain-containing protein [Chitinophagaceae bacterium]|nr:DUF4302 domain-containing protein [Chitinophagaceae bacterium]
MTLNKYIPILILASLVFSGCVKKVDDIFPETPDERIAKSLNAYKSALMEAPGWKLFVYPAGLESQGIDVGGLSYYITFPDSNRTVMVSDFNSQTASATNESGYHLKATQRPSLIFDTYSYIHNAADPDPEVSFSPTQAGGFGWGSDFDFSFEDATPGDTLFLEGNFNHSEAMLIRASQEEIQAAFGGQLQHIVEVTEDFSSNPFLYFPASDNSKIGVAFNGFLKKINFTFLGSSDLQTVSVPYSFTIDGVHFKFPVNVGGYTFQDMYWDEATDRYYINISSGRVYLTNSPTPIFPFYTLIGKYITAIVVPTTPLPGQSPTFATVYDEMKLNLKNSIYNLDLTEIEFIFDDESKMMGMLVNVEQDGIPFVAAYIYTYPALTTSNITRFTRTNANGNAIAVEAQMAPLLDYIENDDFRIDYFTGSSPVLGQFTSLDNSDFFFTGNIE